MFFKNLSILIFPGIVRMVESLAQFPDDTSSVNFWVRLHVDFVKPVLVCSGAVDRKVLIQTVINKQFVVGNRFQTNGISLKRFSSCHVTYLVNPHLSELLWNIFFEVIHFITSHVFLASFDCVIYIHNIED